MNELNAKHIKILLVEDDDVDYLTVQKAFEACNIINELIRVTNGEEACDLILSKKLDFVSYVILLDLNMPKMNGIEFLEWLRNDAPESHRNTSVVVLTTSGDPFDKKESFNYCISGYIIKPVDTNQFVHSMSILGKYWAICELPENK
jgi:CheY-like chemotaxis protein